jgi:hypothetical protein
MASNCRSVTVPKSRLRGRYWRSSPLAFSSVPRCQGECRSQKYTATSVTTEKLTCAAISLPWSHVNQRRHEKFGSALAFHDPFYKIVEAPAPNSCRRMFAVYRRKLAERADEIAGTFASPPSEIELAYLQLRL